MNIEIHFLNNSELVAVIFIIAMLMLCVYVIGFDRGIDYDRNQRSSSRSTDSSA